jgi:hypothetical protein
MPSLRPGTFVRDATKPDRIEFGELVDYATAKH